MLNVLENKQGGRQWGKSPYFTINHSDFLSVINAYTNDENVDAARRRSRWPLSYNLCNGVIICFSFECQPVVISVHYRPCSLMTVITAMVAMHPLCLWACNASGARRPALQVSCSPGLLLFTLGSTVPAQLRLFLSVNRIFFFLLVRVCSFFFFWVCIASKPLDKSKLTPSALWTLFFFL